MNGIGGPTNAGASVVCCVLIIVMAYDIHKTGHWPWEGKMTMSELTPAVLAELKKWSAEAKPIHNCFNEATAQRELRILLVEHADALIAAAEERDRLRESLQLADEMHSQSVRDALAWRDALQIEVARLTTRLESASAQLVEVPNDPTPRKAQG